MTKSKASRTTYTLEKANKAIEALAAGKTAAGAARAAGVTRKTLFNWKASNESFAQRWDDANETVTDAIEATATEKAIAGDTALLIFMLKTRRRNVYQERVEHTGSDGSPLTILIREREDGPK